MLSGTAAVKVLVEDEGRYIFVGKKSGYKKFTQMWRQHNLAYLE